MDLPFTTSTDANLATIAKRFASTSTHYPTAKRGHTSATYKFELDGREYLIKTDRDLWFGNWLTRRLLRHEYAAYRQLKGLPGTPACVGLFDDRYLVLEFIEGQPIRNPRTLPDRFFEELKAIIDAMHARGVAHADLKERNNILQTPDGHPVLVDFGVSSLRKPEQYRLNRWLYRFACQLDTQAYLRHKYGHNYSQMDPVDRQLYRRSWIERASSGVRQLAKCMVRGISNF